MVIYHCLNLARVVKNIPAEPDQNSQEKMLLYLADHMEDATDYSWANAKSEHAVILYEMERGLSDYHETERLDKFRRVYAQRPSSFNKQTWEWGGGGGSEYEKKP